MSILKLTSSWETKWHFIPKTIERRIHTQAEMLERVKMLKRVNGNLVKKSSVLYNKTNR